MNATSRSASAAAALAAITAAGQAEAVSFAACSGFSGGGSLTVEQAGPVSCGTLPASGTSPNDTAAVDVGVASGEIKAYLSTDDTSADVFPGRAVVAGVSEQLTFSNSGTDPVTVDFTFLVDGVVSGNSESSAAFSFLTAPTGFVAGFLGVTAFEPDVPLDDTAAGPDLDLLALAAAGDVASTFEGAVLDTSGAAVTAGEIGLRTEFGFNTADTSVFLDDGLGGTRNTPDDIAFELKISETFLPGDTIYWVTTGFSMSMLSADGGQVVYDFANTGVLEITSESDQLTFTNANNLLNSAVQPIPLPAPGLLLLGGLGALGLMRRRRG